MGKITVTFKRLRPPAKIFYFYKFGKYSDLLCHIAFHVGRTL